jgi:AbrB family looped-hinge helix DNA binding protein
MNWGNKNQKNIPADHTDEKCIGVKMHGSVVVGTYGQIVIPSDVRKLLWLSPGDSMTVITKHGMAVCLIKMDDLDTFMEYMQQEINIIKSTRQSLSHPK